MRDKKDTKTLELPVVSKKRGRPSTGAALSAADRKRRQRAKDWAITANGIGTMNFKEMTTTGLLEQLASAVANTNHDLAKSLALELVKRSKPGISEKVTVTKNTKPVPIKKVSYKSGKAEVVTVTKTKATVEAKQKPVTVTKKKIISTAESMRKREAELKKRISQAKPKQSPLL